MAMATKAKIDDQIFLELHSKGLTSAEIARYFDVSSAAVRSKALTLSRKHPELEVSFLKPSSKEKLPVSSRLSIELDRYMLESSNVHKHLAKLPFESTLDHLDQRNTVILKGLQILEKIQKIGNPQGSDAPKTIQVNQITQYLGNKPTTRPTHQDAQVFDVEQVADNPDTL
jgi:hypothetical protein